MRSLALETATFTAVSLRARKARAAVPEPARPAARRRLSAQERREQLVEAARSVFLSRGLAGSRTKDIADAAGVNEALLYQHFESKEQMFELAVVEPLATLAASIAEQARALEYDPEGGRHFELTRTFIGEMLEIMVAMAPLIGVALFADPSSGRQFYLDKMVPTMQTVEEAVEAALPTFRHRSFSPGLSVQATVWMCLGLAIDAQLRDVDLDLDRAADEITELVFRGVREDG